jgi:hypothetical protein
MRKCSELILLPCAFALLTAERVEAAPVTWDFIATGCSNGPFNNGCVPAQTYPVELATLTLPGPNSSGTAVWNGITAPIYRGSGFSLDFSGSYLPITDTYPGHEFECGPGQLCSFDLSWSESGGQLDAVGLNVMGYNDTMSGNIAGNGSFGLTGGYVASDNIYYGAGDAFAGCTAGQCRISGYWVNDALVTAPEPRSVALLASAFGLWGLTGRRKVLHATT